MARTLSRTTAALWTAVPLLFGLALLAYLERCAKEIIPASALLDHDASSAGRNQTDRK